MEVAVYGVCARVRVRACARACARVRVRVPTPYMAPCMPYETIAHHYNQFAQCYPSVAQAGWKGAKRDRSNSELKGSALDDVNAGGT